MIVQHLQTYLSHLYRYVWDVEWDPKFRGQPSKKAWWFQVPPYNALPRSSSKVWSPTTGWSFPIQVLSTCTWMWVFGFQPRCAKQPLTLYICLSSTQLRKCISASSFTNCYWFWKECQHKVMREKSIAAWWFAVGEILFTWSTKKFTMLIQLFKMSHYNIDIQASSLKLPTFMEKKPAGFMTSTYFCTES